MRILVVGGITRSLINFRGPMLAAFADAGHTVGVCAGEIDEDAVAEMTKSGYQFFPADLSRRGTSLKADWAYYKQMRGVMAAFRPDVVLSYTIKPVIYGSLAASKAGVPCVSAMITGLGAVAAASPDAPLVRRLRMSAIAYVGRVLYRRALGRVDVTFFQNPDDEAFFRSRGLLGQGRVIQIPGSGVDLDLFPQTPAPPSPVRFLLIARLLPEKGVREFVAASEILRQEGLATESVLVGPLETGGSITAQEVEGWHRSGSIRYIGEVRDVKPYLREASVYVLPSYYGEGQPRTILESMAMGRAIITADSPGCRETVREGENGYLVPPRDTAALAQAMRRFVQQPDLIQSLGQRSREIAEAVYDVDKVNRTILDAISQPTDPERR